MFWIWGCYLSFVMPLLFHIGTEKCAERNEEDSEIPYHFSCSFFKRERKGLLGFVIILGRKERTTLLSNSFILCVIYYLHILIIYRHTHMYQYRIISHLYCISSKCFIAYRRVDCSVLCFVFFFFFWRSMMYSIALLLSF